MEGLENLLYRAGRVRTTHGDTKREQYGKTGIEAAVQLAKPPKARRQMAPSARVLAAVIQMREAEEELRAAMKFADAQGLCGEPDGTSGKQERRKKARKLVNATALGKVWRTRKSAREFLKQSGKLLWPLFKVLGGDLVLRMVFLSGIAGLGIGRFVGPEEIGRMIGDFLWWCLCSASAAFYFSDVGLGQRAGDAISAAPRTIFETAQNATTNATGSPTLGFVAGQSSHLSILGLAYYSVFYP